MAGRVPHVAMHACMHAWIHARIHAWITLLPLIKSSPQGQAALGSIFDSYGLARPGQKNAMARVLGQIRSTASSILVPSSTLDASFV